MTLKEHVAESLTAFGSGFEYVHVWLDEFALKPPFGPYHRRLRHHQAGIAEVRERWGSLAAAAARQHVIADLKMCGWTEAEPLPRDEQDYVRLNLK